MTAVHRARAHEHARAHAPRPGRSLAPHPPARRGQRARPTEPKRQPVATRRESARARGAASRDGARRPTGHVTRGPALGGSRDDLPARLKGASAGLQLQLPFALPSLLSYTRDSVPSKPGGGRRLQGRRESSDRCTASRSTYRVSSPPHTPRRAGQGWTCGSSRLRRGPMAVSGARTSEGACGLG